MGRVKANGRCPKCGGNLYLDRDHIGWYEQCLQCAYMKDLAVVYQNKKKTGEEAKEPVNTERKDSINRKVISPDK